ncbi:hypothetical protein M569_03048 [Genlisea aurea]|uniref:protein-serine/threonine phosphatase n=1 Tax=Genlisea aurea TaxID=192259 RepID=S8D2T1_9LAMI|nr:hypothetical protein M569_03048 [Genlisea aurea]
MGDPAADAAAGVEPAGKTSLRKRVEMHQFSFLPSDSTVAPLLDHGGKRKKHKMEALFQVLSHSEFSSAGNQSEESGMVASPAEKPGERNRPDLSPEFPKFGMTSVCGRRRDMEDAVAVCPSLIGGNEGSPLHLFGIYDGHGCSHVATRCRNRLHEILKEEYQKRGAPPPWEQTMLSTFSAMDKEVGECINDGVASPCRCGMKKPQCEAVGSTAVVAVVTPSKIIVSNCGDSRAVLCRNGVAIPLSDDHKPDRPDELARVQDSGGRVIFWDGPRVLGVLAMSRAIGDNYLKPYVISEPEVTITDRTAEDECLILASDGLWDVVSNETACGVARMCLQSRKPNAPPLSPGNDVAVTSVGESSDKSCADASILLTKLALARHSGDNVSVVVVDLRRN